MYTQEDMKNYFLGFVTNGDTSIHRKNATVQARKAIEGEEIVTVIDGEEETRNTAKAGDVVVKGVKEEEYILEGENFSSRYEGPDLTDEYQEGFKAVGKVQAYTYPGKPFKFTAAWGESMICNTGDVLCAPYKSDLSIDEVYRIEKEAFGESYEPFE